MENEVVHLQRGRGGVCACALSFVDHDTTTRDCNGVSDDDDGGPLPLTVSCCMSLDCLLLLSLRLGSWDQRLFDRRWVVQSDVRVVGSIADKVCLARSCHQETAWTHVLVGSRDTAFGFDWSDASFVLGAELVDVPFAAAVYRSCYCLLLT